VCAFLGIILQISGEEFSGRNSVVFDDRADRLISGSQTSTRVHRNRARIKTIEGAMGRVFRVFLLIAVCVPVVSAGQERAVEQSGPTQGSGSGKPGPAISGNRPESKPAPVKKTRPDYVRRDRVVTFAAREVNLAQLEEMVREAHGRHDKAVARELSGLELTERLTGAQLRSWEVALPGKRARSELKAVADASVFLAPPATEIPALDAPEMATQRDMLEKTVEYLKTSIPKLPDFSATEEVIRYENAAAQPEEEGVADATVEPWRQTNQFSSVVRYSGTRQDDGAKGNSTQDQGGDVTVRIFGSILSTLIVDASHGRVTWTRWERNAAGLRAVFHYEVAEENSHYGVSDLAHSEKGHEVMVRQRAGYHGEITIDPTSGVITRITIVADLESGNPVDRSDVMVDYGPVQIDGTTYNLPVRSISIANGRSEEQDPNYGIPFAVEETVLEDTAFGSYRLSGSEPGH
jgi:hypothetical protein